MYLARLFTLVILLAPEAALAASRDRFTFTNDTGGPTNDLHIEFRSAVHVRRTAYPRVGGDGSSNIDLAGAQVAPAQSTSIAVTSSANAIRVQRWWWTLDGRQVGSVHRGCAGACTSP
ncbi:MAG TPA: hypothetical protein PKA64_14230 [Myxococcota bacterium]|nr:hypothetical protein [Myxococcota bacterium]